MVGNLLGPRVLPWQQDSTAKRPSSIFLKKSLNLSRLPGIELLVGRTFIKRLSGDEKENPLDKFV